MLQVHLPFTCLPLKPRHSPCELLVLASYVKDGMLLNEKHRPVLRTGLSAMSPRLSAVMHSSWLIQVTLENSSELVPDEQGYMHD